ncbi:efflux transporter outer membrane subunit [Bordetella bronchialis]|uniref:Protein CyaE n=1 Tax=Bordetella bronchialis TaxID=463025 RepID=A0A193FLV8_9BORD|nr:efflux transporter outer membrane subunit [Bordetella bronchialis]ANN68156.1 multidrug transporter [Bordetella bronchialis]ANN73289.1 multidrug transporter [Bordetella bronchialis]
MMRTPSIMRSTALATALAAALGGCTLAPKYERPAAPVQADWPDQPKLTYGGYDKATTAGMQPASALSPASDVAAADIGWRDFFHDPRLQALIALALQNNRDLRVAVQRVEEARAQWGVQRGQLFPSIGAGVQGTRQHLPRSLRPGGPDSTSISSQYQAGLGLTTFEIDVFGRLRSLSEAAYQQYLSTEQARRSVQISLVGEVAQAYLNLRAADVQLDLTRKTLESRQASYDLVKRRFDGGVASELDLNQAKSLLDAASANLAELARAQAQAVNALVLLTGAPLPPDLPAPAPFDNAQVLAAIPAGLPSALLERRPDILSAENNLRSANANIGAARAAFFPTISLTGLLGSASSSLDDLFKGGHGFWSFSPSITTPIFSGGAIRSNLALAEARNNIAVAQYEQAIQQAFQEVSDALAGVATYGTEVESLRALEASSARTVELSTMRYNGGIDSYLQVQNAQVTYYNAQLQLVQAGLGALLNRVQLYKALGGGWEETTRKPEQTAEAGNGRAARPQP